MQSKRLFANYFNLSAILALSLQSLVLFCISVSVVVVSAQQADDSATTWDMSTIKKHEISKYMMETGKIEDKRAGCIRFGVNIFHLLGEPNMSDDTNGIEKFVVDLLKVMRTPGKLITDDWNQRLIETTNEYLDDCFSLLGGEDGQVVRKIVKTKSELQLLKEQNLLLKQTIVSMKKLIENLELHVDLTQVPFPVEPLFQIPLPGPIVHFIM